MWQTCASTPRAGLARADQTAANFRKMLPPDWGRRLRQCLARGDRRRAARDEPALAAVVPHAGSPALLAERAVDPIDLSPWLGPVDGSWPGCESDPKRKKRPKRPCDPRPGQFLADQSQALVWRSGWKQLAVDGKVVELPTLVATRTGGPRRRDDRAAGRSPWICRTTFPPGHLASCGCSSASRRQCAGDHRRGVPADGKVHPGNARRADHEAQATLRCTKIRTTKRSTMTAPGVVQLQTTDREYIAGIGSCTATPGEHVATAPIRCGYATRGRACLCRPDPPRSVAPHGHRMPLTADARASR